MKWYYEVRQEMNANRKAENRYKGTNLELAEWVQTKLEEKICEKGTTAVCAAVCASGELLAAACAGSRGFDDNMAEVDDLGRSLAAHGDGQVQVEPEFINKCNAMNVEVICFQV